MRALRSVAFACCLMCLPLCVSGDEFRMFDRPPADSVSFRMFDAAPSAPQSDAVSFRMFNTELPQFRMFDGMAAITRTVSSKPVDRRPVGYLVKPDFPCAYCQLAQQFADQLPIRLEVIDQNSTGDYGRFWREITEYVNRWGGGWPVIQFVDPLGRNRLVYGWRGVKDFMQAYNGAPSQPAAQPAVQPANAFRWPKRSRKAYCVNGSCRR